MSIDPLQKKYPWLTPYQFAGNSPVANIDLDGREQLFYVFAWDEKIKGFNCISAEVATNEKTFWDDLFERAPADWSGKKIQGVIVNYYIAGVEKIFHSYKEILEYHAAHPPTARQDDKMSDAQKALVATAFMAAGEVTAQSLENTSAGGSIDYGAMSAAEGEVLAGEKSILRQSILQEEEAVASKATNEKTASGHNGSEESISANTGPSGSKSSIQPPTASLSSENRKVGLPSSTSNDPMVEHHIFNVFRGNSASSQKYRDFFKNLGIKVDDHAIMIPESLHKYLHRAGNNWTTQWKKWIDANPNASVKDVYQQAGKMLDEAGLNSQTIKKYKQ
jgi:hypothetical protein